MMTKVHQSIALTAFLLDEKKKEVKINLTKHKKNILFGSIMNSTEGGKVLLPRSF